VDGCQAVIMAGGQGERLWPLSTLKHPKQFQRLLPGRPSPFEQAFERAVALVGSPGGVWTVTRRSYRDLIRAEVPRFVPANIIAEPCQRNTAPCLALAAATVARRRPHSDVLAVMPADHHVADPASLVAALRAAVIEARRTGAVICLGVRPTRAHTGYGYIEVAEGSEGEASLAVRRFTEKPGEPTAREFLASGRHFWNAGIFVWPLAQVRAEFARHAPEIAAFMDEYSDACSQDACPMDAAEPLSPELEARFNSLPDISLDYAVMERTDNIRLIPVECGWNDLGSFSALAEVMREALGADAAGNTVSAASGAAVTLEAAERVSVHALNGPRKVAVCGLKDAVVVDAPGALLVCGAGYEGRIKELGRKMERGESGEPVIDWRPWGMWETLARQGGFQVKRIRVLPGHRLSLQAHQHRAEHWVVTEGQVRVEVDGHLFQLSHGEHAFIPAGSQHRLSNAGSEEAVIIEVQLGDNLAEDDIIRFEDDYGRVP